MKHGLAVGKTSVIFLGSAGCIINLRHGECRLLTRVINEPKDCVAGDTNERDRKQYPSET